MFQALSSTNFLLGVLAGVFVWWATQYGGRFLIVEWVSLLIWVGVLIVLLSRALSRFLKGVWPGVLALACGVGLIAYFIPVKAAEAPNVSVTTPTTISSLASPGTPEVTPGALAPSALGVERVFFSTPLRDLVAPYRNGTSYQGDQLFAAYAGKWTRIITNVEEMYSDALDGSIRIVGAQDRDRSKSKGLFMVSLEFNRDQAATVSHLTKGEKVSAECQAKMGSDAGIIFQNCGVVR